MLKVEDVTYIYEADTAMAVHALNHITVEIPDGQFIGLVGHTGSGKSTFVQMLNGLLKPTEGHIYWDGQDIHGEDCDRKALRAKVGLVFQYPEHQLFETDVVTDVMFGPKNLGLTPEECRARAEEALRSVGLDEETWEMSPFDLSGGQKRRAAIAGVLAMHPGVLILDEPTAGLDPEGRTIILDEIRNFQEALGSTIIMVSHSMEEIASTVNRLVVMNHGQIFMDGTPAEVFSHADQLREIGLAVPQVTSVFLRLQEMGIPVDRSVYTVEQAKAAILKLKEGR